MKYNAEYRRKRYLMARDRILAKQKEYDDAHKERRRERDAERYRRNKILREQAEPCGDVARACP